MGIGLDVAEVAEVLPELAEERASVVVVEIADDGLNSLGGFIGVVEGDTAVAGVPCQLHGKTFRVEDSERRGENKLTGRDGE